MSSIARFGVDRRLERPSSGVQSRLHGPGRDIEDRRQLRDRSALEVVQDEDRSLIDLEGAERCVEHPRVGVGRVDRRPGDRRRTDAGSGGSRGCHDVAASDASSAPR